MNVAIAFTVLVVAALSPTSWLYRVRDPGAAYMALRSYAIYLSRKPVAVIVQRQLGPIGLPAMITIAIITLICFVIGWLFYRLLETPFMAIRNRPFPPNFPVCPGQGHAASTVHGAVAPHARFALTGDTFLD